MSDLTTLMQCPIESVQKCMQRTRVLEKVYNGRIHYDKCLIRQQFVATLRPPLKIMVRGFTPQMFEEASTKAKLFDSSLMDGPTPNHYWEGE